MSAEEELKIIHSLSGSTNKRMIIIIIVFMFCGVKKHYIYDCPTIDRRNLSTLLNLLTNYL